MSGKNNFWNIAHGINLKPMITTLIWILWTKLGDAFLHKNHYAKGALYERYMSFYYGFSLF